MADNSHALRKIKQRLAPRIVFSLSDALNAAEVEREDRRHLVLGVQVENMPAHRMELEDCEIPGCTCKR